MARPISPVLGRKGSEAAPGPASPAPAALEPGATAEPGDRQPGATAEPGGPAPGGPGPGGPGPGDLQPGDPEPGRAEQAGERRSIDQVISLLRARGGRVTATRRVTLDVLLAGGAHRHLSAEDVAAEVRQRLPDVAESTIYRTLSALEELGVVTHVHLGHGPSTFHLAQQAHRHLVCQRCQTVIEVPAEEFGPMARRLEERYGFTVSGEHFAIAGLCQACRDETS